MQKLKKYIFDLILRPGAFKGPESRFVLSVGLKFLLIPLITSLVVMVFMYMFMELNYLFFEANGYGEIKELQGAYYDYILNDLFDYIPFLGASLVGFFFIGVQVGNILLRPFAEIAKYCEDVIEGYRADYDPEDFSDYRILTRMAEYFFTSMEEQAKEGHLEIKEIPQRFQKIHGPKVDKGFLVNFLLIIIMTLVVYCSLLFQFAMEMHTSIVNLAISSLGKNIVGQALFFRGQESIVNIILICVLVSSSVVYLMVAFNLYSKVAGGSFGIFSTMRSFLKGKHSSRIHLVGYQHLRNYTRMINRYLDYMETNYSEKSVEDNVKLLKKKS